MQQIGINPTQLDTLPLFTLNALFSAVDTDGEKEYVYVQYGAGGSTGAGYAMVIDALGGAVMVTTTNAAPGTGTGKRCGVAMAAAAANQYGWLQIKGKGVVRCAAAVAVWTRMNTTATAGALDDDATTGARAIDGIALHTAAGGAGNAVCQLENPRVGVTL